MSEWTPGWTTLLAPKLWIRRNRIRRAEGGLGRRLLLVGLGVGFWILLFTLVHRVLLHFRGAEGIGDVLAGKLLGMVFLTFFFLLLLSNVITALSTFFLARDLELLLAAPVDPLHLYAARLLESLINSSWMVGLLAVPLLGAYGFVYGAGPAYYGLALAVLGAFLVLPAVLGAGLTLGLVSLFPARRARDLLALLGLLGGAGAVASVRFWQPERLVRPEEFESWVGFLSAMQAPSSPWLPSDWAATVLMSTLSGSGDLFPFYLLGSTAAAAFVLGAALHVRAFPAAFSRAQEGKSRRWVRAPSSSVAGGWKTRSLLRALVEKELRIFFRDPTQWSQLLLLAVLVAVYLYNIRVLPLGPSAELSFFLVHLVGFLNLGLAGFVIAAVAARFIFPAPSLEGRMIWLLRSSPLPPRTLFWVKYGVGVVPLLALALPLIYGTNRLLEVSPLVQGVSVVTQGLATLALAAMALAFGVFFPNFETENPAEIPTSLGGFLFMMASVVYLFLMVLLTGWPLYILLRTRFLGEAFGAGNYGGFILGFGGAILLTLGVTVGALRAGVARFERQEAPQAE